MSSRSMWQRILIMSIAFSLIAADETNKVVARQLSEKLHESLPSADLLWTTNSDEPLVIYVRNKACDKCKLIELAEISDTANASLSLDTYYPDYYFSIVNTDTKKHLCVNYFAEAISMGEKASYLFEVRVTDGNGSVVCTVTELVSPPYSVYAPLWITLGILFGLATIYFFVKYAYRRFVYLT